MNTNIIFMWCICVPLSLMAAFRWKLPAPVVFCLCNITRETASNQVSA